MAQKRKLESLHGETESGVRGLFRSSSIEDRESTFVAAFSPTLSSKELQGHPEFKTASHRIVAWRKRSGQQTLGTAASQIYNTGYDDDGEKYAGKRLERVLTELHVEGSVICARWYGGVLLGPVRFAHIENTAKDAIRHWQSTTDQAPKKIKVDPAVNEAEDKLRLVRQLKQRDQSISVLRKLLTEKTEAMAARGEEAKAGPPPSSSPAQLPQYEGLSLLRLRQLDKARDATISWVLKRIDAAEVKAGKERSGENT